MASPACTPRSSVEVEKPVPVVVPVKVTPPAELLACADRPAGLPEDADLIAQIPTKLRAGIIRLARAFGANASRLDRLVDWSSPSTCSPAEAK